MSLSEKDRVLIGGVQASGYRVTLHEHGLVSLSNSALTALLQAARSEGQREPETAGSRIIAGLAEAVQHAKGEDGATVHHVYVGRQGEPVATEECEGCPGLWPDDELDVGSRCCRIEPLDASPPPAPDRIKALEEALREIQTVAASWCGAPVPTLLWNAIERSKALSPVQAEKGDGHG
jgi:hypothetical protein